MESISFLNRRAMASHSASLIALGVLFFVGVALGVGVEPKYGSEADIGKLTDDILAGLETYATDENLTSMNLPDVRQDFSVTTLWILSLTGWIQLTGGTLSNFQKVNRYGSSGLTFVSDNDSQSQDPISGQTTSDQIILRTGIELPDLQGSYDFLAKVGVVKPKGKIGVKVSGVKATVFLTMRMDTLKPFVVEMKVVDLGKIKIDVQDGVVGWVASAISNVVASFMKRTLKDTVEAQLPPLINDLLDKLDIAGMLKPPSNLVN